jgi:hypothetical protein
MLDYPVRAGIGDALLLVPGLSVERQQRLKQAIIDATALPTTRGGKAVEDIASFPGSMVAAGVSDVSRRILGDKATDFLSPYAQAGADLLPFGAAKYLSRDALPRKPSERWAAVK